MLTGQIDVIVHNALPFSSNKKRKQLPGTLRW